MDDWQVLKQVPKTLTWSELIKDIVNYFDEDGQLVISSKSSLTNPARCDFCFANKKVGRFLTVILETADPYSFYRHYFSLAKTLYHTSLDLSSFFLNIHTSINSKALDISLAILRIFISRYCLSVRQSGFKLLLATSLISSRVSIILFVA